MHDGYLKFIANNRLRPLTITFGELAQYDPATHMGKFYLMNHPQSGKTGDPNDGNPIETSFIPIGTFFTGPGYGMQFAPILGAQALIIFQENTPVASVLLANRVENPPFANNDRRGWIDEKQSFVTTTEDGQGTGDGQGGVRMGSPNYASIVTALLELGAEGLDANDNAVIRVKDLKAFRDNLANALGNWALASLQPGSGATQPDLSQVHPSGSTKVRGAD